MDFVTYEIGKKMQEKGYPHGYNRFGCRPIYSDECTIKYLSDIGVYEEEYYGEHIPCPIISEVLKWLREEKRIDVGAIWVNSEGKWIGYVNEMDMPDLVGEYLSHKAYDTYELAALAGIEYVLDNLI